MGGFVSHNPLHGKTVKRDKANCQKIKKSKLANHHSQHSNHLTVSCL